MSRELVIPAAIVGALLMTYGVLTVPGVSPAIYISAYVIYAAGALVSIIVPEY